MIRLIGTRCTDSNVFSQGVLIVRFLLGNVEIIIVAFVTRQVYLVRVQHSVFRYHMPRYVSMCILENLIVEFFVLVIWQ